MAELLIDTGFKIQGQAVMLEISLEFGLANYALISTCKFGMSGVFASLVFFYTVQ